jgi:hypothetical protein
MSSEEITMKASQSIVDDKIATSFNSTSSVSASMSKGLETSSTDQVSTNQSNKDSAFVNKGGRPTKYSLGIALEICERIADGESLVKICSDPKMPKKTAVYEWLLRYKEFADIYARAREDQADTLADEIHAISDELPQQIVDDKGKTRYDSAYVQWQKNRVDARKWVAAKLKPKKYSDRIAHVGDNEADSIQVNVNIFDEMLKNLELKRQAK